MVLTIVFTRITWSHRQKCWILLQYNGRGIYFKLNTKHNLQHWTNDDAGMCFFFFLLSLLRIYWREGVNAATVLVHTATTLQVCPWFVIHPVKSKSHLMTEPVESGENRISRSNHDTLLLYSMHRARIISRLLLLLAWHIWLMQSNASGEQQPGSMERSPHVHTTAPWWTPIVVN